MSVNDPLNNGRATRIMFKPEFTPGNIVSWLVMIIGFVYGYSQLNGKVDNIAYSISEMKSTDNQLQAQINVMRDLNTARQIDVSTKMTRLETILERMEGKFDNRLPSVQSQYEKQSRQ